MDFAEGYEGVTVAGVAVVTPKMGGRVLLAQRAYDETDDDDVRETWEVVGGHLEPGEEPFAAAAREFAEEIGVPLPEGEVVNGWRSEDGQYQGFVLLIEGIIDLSQWQPTDEVQAVGWYLPKEARTLNLRPEVAAMDLEGLVTMAVSGNAPVAEVEVAAAQVGTDDEYLQVDDDGAEVDDIEPEFDVTTALVGPIPIHGVIAPEEAESGDSRAFNAGAMTVRPLRLPFRWQKSDIGGHDGAIVVGSVDRIMRKDGLIHYEGLLMSTVEADELTEVIEFFGKFGVSVDGDRGALDAARSNETGVTWFDAVRAAGLTAVAIPAFSEAYVALGPHPDFPAEAEDDDTLVAGACSPQLMAFKRGPGWVTNPRETSRLHRYWTEKGQPGYAKVAWGTPGDWRRAKALIGEKILANSPEKAKYLNQIISQWHYDALGYWPGDLDKPGNKTSAEAKAERAARASIENEGIEAAPEDSDAAWETVLVSSGARVKPPLSYFHRHEDAGALVIEEPDANGIVRTYGYAAEWGVCHIGMSGVCVEPPFTGSDDYPEFHLGRTETDEGYIYTGVLTCGVGHRDAKTILSESADQAFFDNINNAWASVRVGEDERGIWFSGVVLPGVDPDLIVKIEASGQVSGEWLRGAMRACLTVNVPGFAVERPSAEYDEDGNVIALAASAFGGIESPCDPTPIERMAALRRAHEEAEAEARFAVLKQTWGA